MRERWHVRGCRSRPNREDRGRDHRPKRRVRAKHQDPRGPKYSIADQAQDRGVEACDRRQTGKFGVGHALRYQQCAEHIPATRSLRNQEMR